MITENQLEQLCLDWFLAGGYNYAFGPDIAHDGDTPERRDYQQVVLVGRLLTALQKVNPHIPLATLEEAAQAVTKPESPVLIHSNRAFCKRLFGELAPSAAETETADAI
jgi:type I restriction enzyme, R subunit